MKIIKKRKIEGKRYTIKNLQCPVCGYEKTIYAGGIRDEAEANQAIDKINKQYKKEERL
jgi:hydrogenase maturation factor HypF (carbamoyltransferase family)